MLCHARLEIEIDCAERIVEALKPDDPEWCRCYAENEKIIIVVEVKKLGTLLSALDDYLMNIKMCEKILEAL
ncbi:MULTISPECIES: KEOPS complex subunit Pcc1 [unclassified Archaeoglobus]|uniref:KEOPS complex subunit Pcc1 n=1 Tax=unclassified Archaeoglobus TaxID=2643606 RepID=UPI0025BE744C|nr:MULTISPECIES: KEOPS complex subunit Pcc1 [unclassified Archaeoglobus]